jgi:hypothetical protein
MIYWELPGNQKSLPLYLSPQNGCVFKVLKFEVNKIIPKLNCIFGSSQVFEFFL